MLFKVFASTLKRAKLARPDSSENKIYSFFPRILLFDFERVSLFIPNRVSFSDVCLYISARIMVPLFKTSLNRSVLSGNGYTKECNCIGNFLPCSYFTENLSKYQNAFFYWKFVQPQPRTASFRKTVMGFPWFWPKVVSSHFEKISNVFVLSVCFVRRIISTSFRSQFCTSYYFRSLASAFLRILRKKNKSALPLLLTL